MKHDLHDYLHLGLKNWKTIVAILVFFGVGSLGGYNYKGYVSKPAEPVIEHQSCVCDITSHLRKEH